MNWWLAAGSLAAVLALAGMAWLLKLGGTQRLETGADAIRLAEALSSGFEGKAGIVSTSGEFAAVAGGPGDLVLVEPMGARHRARRISGARIAMLDGGPDGATITLQGSPGEMFRITVADIAAVRAFADTLGS
ncbi:hypothetical protein OK349_11520 [Sphingomonas sp. BT-65]|uniref:hypothetical protein n=1 Tax=Sphingomonas sp. BT-65 TaxID=2989821 RepID=UPI0022360284|nr:hypothetical protein [Sphingomonas sp. BT-65]MCW4462336.1 hypothetical protein [Sphingomonas sp. BT-65]